MHDESISHSGKIKLEFVQNTNKLSLSKGSITLAQITLPSSLNGKNVVLWVTGSVNGNVIKVAISNYSAKLTINTAINFLDHNFVFKTEDGIIRKYMYSPNFYDFDSEQYHRIMLQEKLNGSYIL